MAFCGQQILALASGIYSSIQSPSSQTPAYISGWITMSGTLGDINNKLSTSFWLTGDGPCIYDSNQGDFAGEEANILTLMYKASYYEGLSISLLLGGGPTYWTSLTEGDSKINRDSSSNLSKAATLASQESNKLLRWAIHDYTLRMTVPQVINGSPPFGSPSP